jgi:hypothetical protein
MILRTKICLIIGGSLASQHTRRACGSRRARLGASSAALHSADHASVGHAGEGHAMGGRAMAAPFPLSRTRAPTPETCHVLLETEPRRPCPHSRRHSCLRGRYYESENGAGLPADGMQPGLAWASCPQGGTLTI